MKINKKEEVILSLDIMKRKNVKEFINAASNWRSGYSMGETVSVIVKKEDGTSQEYVIKDSRKKYSVKKYNINIKYGRLSLTIIEREGRRSLYKINEVIKSGHQAYKDYIQDYRKRKTEHLKAQRITNDFEKRFLINNETKSLAFEKLNLWIPSSYDIIDVVPVYRVEHPTMKDYFNNTKVSFHIVDMGEPNQIKAKWKEMKSTTKLSYHRSPFSCSEYLEDEETGTVYRYSDHWGLCASCEWTINGKSEYIDAIGMAALSEFERTVRCGTTNKIDMENVNVCVEKLMVNETILSDFLTAPKYAFYDDTKAIFEKLIDHFHGIVEQIGNKEYEQAAERCKDCRKYIEEYF